MVQALQLDGRMGTLATNDILHGVKQLSGSFLKGVGARTDSVIRTALLSTLGWAWLSVCAALWLRQYMPSEASAAIMGVVFFASALWVHRSSKRKLSKALDESEVLIKKYTDKLENVSVDDGLAVVSQELKEAAVEAINPLPEMKDFVVKHPAASILSGLALGIMFGIRNRRAGHV